MTYLRTWILFLGLIVAAAAQAELRVYDVDPRYRQEVFEALRSVLSRNDLASPGTISVLPTGQLLVDTSSQMHAQVGAVLESINTYHAEPTPRVTLRYWAVLGTRAPELSSGQGLDVPEVLAEVLDEIRRSHGDLSFRLHGAATLVSGSGQQSELSGQTLNVTQTAYVQPSRLDVELAMDFQYTIATQVPKDDGESIPYTRREQQALSLRTSLEPNEFVVVSENTMGENLGTVFYIVQWAVAE